MYKVTVVELEMYYEALKKADHALRTNKPTVQTKMEVSKALNHIKTIYINNIKNKNHG